MTTQDELQARIGGAVEMILDYGSIDGAHHKQWTLDQALRILTGCPTVTASGIDYAGKPYSYGALGESEEYKELVRAHCEGEDGPETYEWDTGIAP